MNVLWLLFALCVGVFREEVRNFLLKHLPTFLLKHGHLVLPILMGILIAATIIERCA